MPKENHSQKALKTLSLMNTTADRWHVADIEWKKEIRPVPTKVKCPTCHGAGRAYVRKESREFVCGVYNTSKHVRAFNVARGEENRNFYSETDKNQWLAAEGIIESSCPQCPPRRKWTSYGTGEVIAFVEREVWIGYILWPEGTRFDSRFKYSGDFVQSRTHCQLCAKGINKSGRVPVVGYDESGAAHGMFVGEDCARKFMSFEGFKGERFISDNLETQPETATASEAVAS